MARVNIPVQVLTDRNVFATATDFASIATAIDAADGAEFIMSERDDKYLVLVHNAGASEQAVTIKHSNGIQGVCDLELEALGAGKYTFVALDSGRFKHVSGDDKGKVLISGGSADVKIAVFQLP